MRSDVSAHSCLSCVMKMKIYIVVINTVFHIVSDCGLGSLIVMTCPLDDFEMLLIAKIMD